MVCRDGCIFVWLMLPNILTAAPVTNEGPRCPPSEPPGLCQEAGHTTIDEYFYNVAGTRIQLRFSGSYFYFICSENVTLESEYLPQFSQRIEVEKVKLSSCPPPEGGYASALLNFNVTVRTCLELDKVPSSPALGARHFEGLHVAALTLQAADAGAPLRPDPGFFSPLIATLIELKLADTRVPPQALLTLPPRLRVLTLHHTSLAELPAAALARLPALRQLVLEETAPLRLAVGTGAPLELYVNAPLTALMPGRAENVTLVGAQNVSLSGDCDALGRLTVSNADTALPASWLARCPRVTELSLRRVRAGAAELRGATALQLLSVQRSGLRELPPDWLADAADLIELDLSYNIIEALPVGLLGRTLRLRTLRLSDNRLLSLQPALLGPLPALAALDLARNPLGDLCSRGGAKQAGTDWSPLRQLRALRSLRLVATGATRVCSDWRALPRLESVDLSRNNITQLEFSDLKWAMANVSVDLHGSNITTLTYTREEYELAVRADGPVLSASVAADWALVCDCAMYWTARAFRERPTHAPALRGARCGSGAAAPGVAAPGLADPALDDFMCEVKNKTLCPAGCACAEHPEGSELTCARAALPPRGALRPVRRVRARGLRALSPALLTADLAELDVANGSLARVPAETAALLFAAPQRRVWLAGNPWECDCEALPLLRVVARHVARVPDATRAKCRTSGRALLAAAAALDAECSSARLAWAWAWAPALALAAAGALLTLAATRPALRQRVKQFLFARGLCLRWLLRPFDADEAADASRPYDAFVSFSHHDAAYAMELAAKLEGDAGGRRLCLHERDWTPGEWIPAQIATSVRAARRTLVLLSESFLQSQWARAEFREAYSAALREHRPRLLLVLLPGVSADALATLRAEPELRAYLARVTYLRWDDPRFWLKLDLALPARAPAPADAPPAA